MTIRINALRILLYCLTILCAYLAYHNYKLANELELQSNRINETVEALNGWAGWVQMNMYTLDEHGMAWQGQDGFNRSVVVNVSKLQMAVSELQQIELKRQQEQHQERRLMDGYIYNIREGELSVLCESQEVVGIQELRVHGTEGP